MRGGDRQQGQRRLRLPRAHAAELPGDLPPCFAVFIANTWPKAATLTVTLGGQSYDVTKFARIPKNGQPEAMWPTVDAAGLPADEVAVLFLSGDPAAIFQETGEPMKCPVPTAVAAATSLQQTGKTSAFHITSDVPVSAYDILPYAAPPPTSPAPRCSCPRAPGAPTT